VSDYPKYEVAFIRNAPQPEAPKPPRTDLAPGENKLGIDGPHTIVLSPSKSRVQISLEHNSEDDRQPNLRLIVTDLD